MVANCNILKSPAASGKNHLTDVANTETVLRLIQSVPGLKEEPIKHSSAKASYELMRKCPTV